MKRMATFIFALGATSIMPAVEPTGNGMVWPEGKKAAVVLTYDDGLDCHLDVAAPMLDEFGFKGTFFCTGQSWSLFKRMEEWRDLVRRGHELGNHSLFHPCDGSKHDWVKPEYDLNGYSLEQIRNELLAANTLLQAVDGKTERTYAYTCSDFRVSGGASYVDLTRELFAAARSDGPIPGSRDELDLHFMPSRMVVDLSGAELIHYVEEAREKGTIAILMFHSVGGGYLNISGQAHRELLVYLKAREKDYWVATFMEVCRHLQPPQPVRAEGGDDRG